MHPNAAISIAASKNSVSLTNIIYGDDVVHTPWLRPGFELGLAMQKICRENPHAKGIIMGQHGLINWANDEKECYELTLSLIEKAATYIEAKYQEKGGDATAFGGQRYVSLDEAPRRAAFAKILPWLAGRSARRRASSAPSGR
jgi:rhamnose utilization protein RhaD (predicted bifunctional aldolase and dehydrogenase)